MGRVHRKRSAGKRKVGRVRAVEVPCPNRPVGTVARFLGSGTPCVD